MTREAHVEIVRRIYEDGLFDDDPEQLLALASPEIEYVNWTFRDGMIVRHEWGRDLGAALEAVGLEPLR